MDKRHLVDAIAKETGFSKTDTAKMVNATIDTISKTLARKERITIVDFGTFYTVARKPRKARNPKTGTVINIPKRTVPRWRASPTIKSKVK